MAAQVLGHLPHPARQNALDTHLRERRDHGLPRPLATLGHLAGETAVPAMRNPQLQLPLTRHQRPPAVSRAAAPGRAENLRHLRSGTFCRYSLSLPRRKSPSLPSRTLIPPAASLKPRPVMVCLILYTTLANESVKASGSCVRAASVHKSRLRSWRRALSEVPFQQPFLDAHSEGMAHQ